MKIFISWSGEQSKDVAKELKKFIKLVIQASKPWISNEDIQQGSLWFSKIKDSLNESKAGIICLTKENKEKPWVLFEAGALLNKFTESKICPLLIGLEPKDIEQPLSQFNLTLLNKEEMEKLFKNINDWLGENKLENEVLDASFNVHWKNFENAIEKIIKRYPENKSYEGLRDEKDYIQEILYSVRNLDKRMRSLELNRNREYEFMKSNIYRQDDNNILYDKNLNVVLSDIKRLQNKDYPTEKIIDDISKMYEISKRDVMNYLSFIEE